MPNYIGKQPNGKWFLFSSVTDRFHEMDLESKPRGVEGQYTWEQVCIWDRYMNNPWDESLRDLIKASREASPEGCITLEEENKIIDAFFQAKLKAYESMSPEETQEVILLHRKHCYEE